MSRLRGEELYDAWPQLDAIDRETLGEQLGSALATLHALELPPGLRVPRPMWSDFLRTQTSQCVDRQRMFGLEERWVYQIDSFLERVSLQPVPRPALLHTEVMREHLFVERTSKGWAWTGLIDFEPALIGDAEYEFASVGVFVSSGDREFLRRCLTAYGYRSEDLEELKPRLLAHALLHRYSKLSWYLERVPPPPNLTSLDALADVWWGTAAKD